MNCRRTIWILNWRSSRQQCRFNPSQVSVCLTHMYLELFGRAKENCVRAIYTIFMNTCHEGRSVIFFRIPMDRTLMLQQLVFTFEDVLWLHLSTAATWVCDCWVNIFHVPLQVCRSRKCFVTLTFVAFEFPVIFQFYLCGGSHSWMRSEEPSRPVTCTLTQIRNLVFLAEQRHIP